AKRELMQCRCRGSVRKFQAHQRVHFADWVSPLRPPRLRILFPLIEAVIEQPAKLQINCLFGCRHDSPFLSRSLEISAPIMSSQILCMQRISAVEEWATA